MRNCSRGCDGGVSNAELLTPLWAEKMVGALLLNMERRGKHSTPPLDPAIIAELRERLWL